MAVEDLAQAYAGQPVVFLEYNVDDDTLNTREWRWWSAFSGSTVTLPMVMVDSGKQISSGYEDFDTKYRSMVDTSLARAPQAEITASGQRVGDSFHFDVTVQNTSDVTLNSSNNATVWAIVYETFDANGTGRLTNRFVRGFSSTSISSALSPGDSGSFTLDTPALSGVVWDNLQAIVLVDYLPSGSSGAYDMLQAVSVNLLP